MRIDAAKRDAKPNVAKAILDTSALLAYINGEKGGDVVADLIGDAAVSTVNFAEAIGKLVQRGRSLELALEALSFIEFDIIDFDRGLAARTGGLIVHTLELGLSLGDRACLALAEREGVPAVTADSAWKKLKLQIDIRLIR